MPANEAVLNQQIASARVHVERAIQRMKLFKILKNRYPRQLFPVINEVLLVAAGIVNLSRPILAEEKFL